MDCPQCGKKAGLVQLEYDVPHFGKLLFSTVTCAHCGFRLSDVMAVDVKKPMRYTARIEKPADLAIKMVKSASATVRVPEFGVEIEPGPACEGYLTNVEGFLERVQSAGRVMAHAAETPAEKKAATSFLDTLSRARDGKAPFSLVVEDPLGHSALVGPGVEKRVLSKKEAAALKSPVVIFGE